MIWISIITYAINFLFTYCSSCQKDENSKSSKSTQSSPEDPVSKENILKKKIDDFNKKFPAPKIDSLRTKSFCDDTQIDLNKEKINIQKKRKYSGDFNTTKGIDKKAIEKGAGLQNGGNTCFMNASLQLLYTLNNELNLKDIIKNWKEQNKNKALDFDGINLILDVLDDITKTIKKNSDKNPILDFSDNGSLKKLRHQFKDKGYGISYSSQEDANEFLEYMFSSTLRYIMDINIIKNNFFNELVTTITCSNCQEKIQKNQTEPVIHLALDSNTEKTISELLQEFSEDYTLDGDNQYECSSCKKKVKATHSIKNEFSSKYKFIHLKRFLKDDYSRNIQKNDTKIKYPLRDIEMTFSDGKTVNYTIISSIIQSGSLWGGHYWNVSKRGDKWYKYNDSSVTELSEDNASKEIENSYILLLERVDS